MTYENSIAKHNEAQKVFHTVRDAYRARTVGDAEFLAALDAPLLDAAPDMLKVLEAIHAHLINGDRCYTIMAAMAEQAIAKAKGKIL